MIVVIKYFCKKSYTKTFNSGILQEMTQKTRIVGGKY